MYKIEADYLQLGVCWRNSLYGKCRETMFPIYSVNNKTKSGSKIDFNNNNSNVNANSIINKDYNKNSISKNENNIKDLNDESSFIKEGLMTKKFSACASENDLLYPDALEIIFPDNSSYYDKFLMTLCGLIIEYRFYEIDPRDNE